MITREQWDALTPQQQYDQYILLLSECGDRDEADTVELTDIDIEKLRQETSGD